MSKRELKRKGVNINYGPKWSEVLFGGKKLKMPTDRLRYEKHHSTSESFVAWLITKVLGQGEDE